MHVYKGKFKRATKFLRRLLAVVIAGAFVLSGGLLGPMPVRAEGTTITWKGTAGDGKWETVSNWDLGRVPVDRDTVRIPELSVVECVYADVTVTLDCSGTLTVSGGTLNLTGTSYLKKGKLDGAGSIEVTGAGSELIWQGGDILGTGSFTVGTDAKLQVKSLTTKELKRPLSCDGTIELIAGYLNLSGGGQVDGSIILSQNTTLKFAGENYTINGSLSDTGSGGMTVDAGNVAFAGAYDIKHTTVEAGATASWNGDTSISVSSLIVKGNAIFNKDISVSGLNLQLGTISGSGNITLVSGGSNQIWAGGSIEGSGELIIESTAKNLDVSGNCSLSRHLTNNGFMMIGSGLLELLGGASGTGGFKVQAGGTLIIRGTGSYSFGGEYPVTNYGQLIISDTCTEVKLNTALEQQSATGILTFDIGENGRFCKLEIINNQARISGSQLKINLLDGFIPSPGQTFEVMTYTSCSGNFASITTDAEGITFEPTYNQTNLTLKAVSTIEQAATPTATPSAGTYTEAQYVALTTTTAGATIHYTTDGSDPTTGSTAYSGPIEVTKSMTIKAIAVKEGLTDSPVATFAYVIEPTDTDPPLVEAYTPENGAVDVALDTNALVLEFNEPVWGINNKALSIHEKQGDWKAADIYAQSADNDYMTGNGTTTISFNISSVSLKLGKEYYIKIASGAFKDAAGNDYTGISDSATWTFTVENDTQAPTVPTNLRCVSKTASTVELAWDASTDDHGPIRYNIYVKNGAEYAFVGESTTNSFTVSKLDYSTPLTPDTTYTFVVCALDGKNNASGYSNELTVTVKDPPQAADEPFWRYRSPLPTWRDLTEVKYLNGKFMGLGGQVL